MLRTGGDIELGMTLGEFPDSLFSQDLGGEVDVAIFSVFLGFFPGDNTPVGACEGLSRKSGAE